MKKIQQHMAPLALWLVPIVLLLIGSAMALKMFPIYSGEGPYVADPAYAYLFNGLLLLDGHVPYHIDHPGTPLQMLIAALVYAQWCYYKLISTVNADVIVAVMAEPERYLLFISRVLLALNALAVFFLGHKVLEATKNIYLAIFCQCALLTLGIFGTKLLYPAPEALVACLSLCLLAILTPLIFQSNAAGQKSTQIAIGAGFIFGLGFAAKLNFLPMVVLLLLFRSWRHVLIAAGAGLLGWLVGILPIMTKLLGFWAWAVNMFTHTGKYGGGSKGIVDLSQVMVNLTRLVNTYPFFYVVVVVFIGYLLCLLAWLAYKAYAPRAKPVPRELVLTSPQTGKIIFILLIVCVGQTLIVLKHFGEHYMIPALPVAFVGFAALMHKLLEVRPNLGFIIKSVLMASVMFLVVQTNYSAFNTLKADRIKKNQAVQSVQREIAKHPNPLVIGSYGCALPQCGLLFGIEYSPAIDKKIVPFLQNFYGFNVWNSMLLIDGHGFYPLSVLQPFLKDNRPIFLITQIDFPAFDLFKKELILTVDDQKLYKITGLTLAQ